MKYFNRKAIVHNNNFLIGQEYSPGTSVLKNIKRDVFVFNPLRYPLKKQITFPINKGNYIR